MAIDPLDGSAQVLGGHRSHPVPLLATPPCIELCPMATRLSLVTLFFLSMSIKDRPLLWLVVRSQTYYPEHILVYGSRKCSLLSCRGFQLFSDRLIGGGDGGDLSTTLSPGLRSGGLESKFGRGPGPMTGE